MFCSVGLYDRDIFSKTKTNTQYLTSAGPLNLNLPTERRVLFWAGPLAAPSHVGCDSWCSCNGGLVTTAGCQIFSGKKQMCSLSVCLILNGVLLAQKQRHCHCTSSLDVLNFPWFVLCLYTVLSCQLLLLFCLCMCMHVWVCREGVKMLTLSTRCLPRWRSLCNVNGVFKGTHVTRRLKVALETDIAARDGPCLTDPPKILLTCSSLIRTLAKNVPPLWWFVFERCFKMKWLLSVSCFN